ncbi:transcription factor MYB119-like [Ipomoea triloba]|uniref:transcription factor MYB119-like n=1 Tax=Ipomoea triloba TaxID=35885 RepID=UPI00125E7B2D|nr:transcription factor MYB119-like [Ipomoea triloba]
MDGGGGGYGAFAVKIPPVIVHQRNDHQEIPFPESLSFHGGASSTNSLWLSHLPNVNFPHRLVPENGSSPQETRREKEHERRSAFIKGQWTEEEDRLLIRLVNQYGDRRWSVIATNIVGRAGKQCRERWHNHLRPDIIKKEWWSEEEERVLVEVHEQLGNRWSENSIKNHWNATKRRQFSKRRMRSASLQEVGGSRKSVVLHNYIKYKYFSGLTLGPLVPVPEHPSIQQQVNVHDSPSILTETYDEEMTFLQKLFGNSSSSSPSTAANNNSAEFAAFGRRTNEDSVAEEEDSWSTYLASDPNLYEMGGADQINSTPQAAAANNTNSGAACVHQPP